MISNSLQRKYSCVVEVIEANRMNIFPGRLLANLKSPYFQSVVSDELLFHVASASRSHFRIHTCFYKIISELPPSLETQENGGVARDGNAKDFKLDGGLWCQRR